MRRRCAMAIAGGLPVGIAAASLGGAMPAWAQTPPKVYRLGLLSQSVRREDWPVMPALREIGYEDGRNIALDYRYANADATLLPAMAAELVAARPDLLLAVGGVEARALLQHTQSIPIVASALGPDPVQDGLVASLARPGANLTGVTGPPASIGGRTLQLLREAVPGLARIVYLSDVEKHPSWAHYGQALRRDAAGLGLKLQWHAIGEAAELPAALIRIARERPDALSVGLAGLVFAERARIIALAMRERIPAMYSSIRGATEGGLMAYAANNAAIARRVAAIIDRVLKGHKPSDIAVEQPTHYDFAINQRTARAMNFMVPYSVLLQATEVIE
jgi:putative tryptophan/tyrosine transport system substrate-binding protein